MTGAVPFDDGFGGAIYLCWPFPEPSWQLLGFLSNDKPSAIFRISGIRPPSEIMAVPFAMPEAGIAQVDDGLVMHEMKLCSCDRVCIEAYVLRFPFWYPSMT